MKAVRFYLNDGSGIPDGWPREVREVTSADELRPGETQMTDEEYLHHVTGLSEAKEAWNQAQDGQTTWEQLTLIENLSDEELLALEDICLPGHPARAMGVRIRAALLGAVETYSRTARTKLFIGAAIQLGIVADVERARVILDDPGFTLE